MTRAYESPLRRQRAAATRRRIVLAGSELLHESPVRDWGRLTIRAVAARAGVNERTVYRHFVNERHLRDAVMAQLEEEAGIDLDAMSLADVAGVAAHIFRYLASFPPEPRPPLDPTLSLANERQHTALLQALAHEAPGCSSRDRTTAASVLDLLWSVGAYERLVGEWELEPAQAIEALCWVIGLVETAVRDEDAWTLRRLKADARLGRRRQFG